MRGRASFGAPHGRAARILAGAAVAGLLLAACGVPVDDQPERIDAPGLQSPSPVQPSPVR